MNKKILILRVNAIGDVTQTTISALAIKQKHPDYIVHYVTAGYCAKLLEPCSYIDKVFVYSDEKNLIEKLKKEKYDIVYCMNHSLKYAFFAFKLRPKKIVFRAITNKSWVEQYFLTAKKGIKDIELPKRLLLENNKEIDAQIENRFKDYKRPFIIFSPGKLYNQPRQGRVWDIEKWIETAKKLKEKYGGTIFVIGGYDELEYHQKLQDENIIILSGKLQLQESSCLLSKANLVISGDSGPVHIASAHNTKTLAILGSTSPDKIKPFGENGFYIAPTTKCRYCWRRKCKKGDFRNSYAPCIQSITPDMVMEKIEKDSLL